MKTNAAASAPVSAGRPAALVTLFWCLVGVLIPRATLYGELSPFGISLAAAFSGGVFPMTGAVGVGYLLAEGALYPLRYIGAVAAVGGVRWVLTAVPGWRDKPLWPPLLAGLADLCTGLVFFGKTGMDGYRLLLLLAESLVAAGAACFFHTAVLFTRRAIDPRPRLRLQISGGEQTALVIAGALAVMAAATLEIGGFSPGRVLAALLVLWIARSGREMGGATAGVILGACTALAGPGKTVAALALAFGGLLAGLFARFGKAAQAGAFVLAAGVMSLADSSENPLLSLYELSAAALLFCLIPHRENRWLSRLFLRRRELPAAEGLRRATTLRLQVAAEALREVSDTVEEVSHRLSRHGAPSRAGVVEQVRRRVCESCPLNAFCWEQHGRETAAGLSALLDGLSGAPEEKGGGEEGKAEGNFLDSHCRQRARVRDALSSAFESYLTREDAWRRLQELQHSLRGQFDGTTDLLAALAEELENPEQVDLALSAQVMAACADADLTVEEALCTRDGGNRMTVNILALEDAVPDGRSRWLRRLEAVCERRFAPPAVTPCGEGVRIVLSERPRFRVEFGLCQLCCAGERLCGDAVDRFAQRGLFTVLLSDGMGSGARACVDSAMTVGLCSRLWQAGFRPTGILRTVNAALISKSSEESLATLDVVQVDEFTGRLDFYKAGAAASLLLSKGRVSRLEQSSLPAGILPEAELAHGCDWLTDGDILLLASDGAYTDGIAPAEELLRSHPPEETMEQLAQRIAQAARRGQGEHQDDVTVVALRLHRLAEES